MLNELDIWRYINFEFFLKVKIVLPATHKVINSSSHRIYFDPKVNLYHSSIDKFIVRGFGLLFKNDNYFWMDQTDWINYFKNNQKEKIAGHYLKIQWDEKEISFSNDYFGLNTIYVYKNKNVSYFSSRLDYLCKIIESPVLNLSAFAGRWILFNQLTYEAIIKDVIKLPPNSILKISKNEIQIKTKNTDEGINYNQKFFDRLNKLCNIIMPDDHYISLGLSGGLDSRIILAQYLDSKKNIKLHSFGNIKQNDVLIASQIASDNSLEHNIFDSIIDEDSIFKELTDFLGLNELVEPISTYILTSGIHNSYFDKKILVDGAGGELFRRQFLNRLIITGKKALKTKNPSCILKYISLIRADIFNDEINSMLKESALDQISLLIEKLPDPNNLNIEDYVDLFAATNQISQLLWPGTKSPELNHTGLYAFC